METNQYDQRVWKDIKPTPKDIQQILADHSAWLKSSKEKPPPHNLNNIKLAGVNLIRADLREISLISADLRGSVLSEAKFNGSNLSVADFGQANLFEADLSGTYLEGTDFDGARVTGVKYRSLKTCRGIRAGSCFGSPRFRRHVMDQDYIEELRESKRWKWLYWPWLISSNCGRSFSLWVLWSVVFAVTFALVYLRLGESAFDFGAKLNFNLMTVFYYSVVTFTTLGFGDVTPVTMEAQIWVIAEVILGYIMLGGLISIFANKVARRAG